LKHFAVCDAGKIPESLFSLACLQTLILRDNSFVGSIPESIGKCTLLEDVDFGANQLTGTNISATRNENMI
jgi:hypothetical protein